MNRTPFLTVTLLCCLLSVFCCPPVCSLAADTPEPLKVSTFKLGNGFTVWLNVDHSQPKVYGAVVVKAGAKDCPNTGIAHYFEHIMFKGTDRIGTVDYKAERPWLDSIAVRYDELGQTRDPQQRALIQQKINRLSLKAADYAIPNEFSRLIAKYGGSGLNAATGPDMTYYYNTFLPQYLHHWCILNSERLIHPVYRLFQGELENVYEEKNRSSDILGDAIERVQKAIFRDQPYGAPVIGSTENLKNPSQSQMDAFYKKFYVASNMGLMLSGDIDTTGLRPLLEETFGKVQTGPVPVRTPSPMPEIKEGGTSVDISLPIPLVKARALVFSAPTDYRPEAIHLDLANAILSNGKAGYLDSLSNEHVLLAALCGRMAFKDAGVQYLLALPNLPFGRKQKAIERCMDQMERVMNGDFTDEMLETQKQNLLREEEQRIETIEERANVMTEVFANDLEWNDYLTYVNNIRNTTRDDVVRAARKYFSAYYITFTKRFGTGKKERLTQPGYMPVRPRNAGAASSFADSLACIPIAKRDVRLADFNNDVQTSRLNEHAWLYTKENPVNDIFSLELKFHAGERDDHHFSLLAQYLSNVGTDSLSKQQFEKAWQRMNVDFSIQCDKQSTSFRLTGREGQMEKALDLLRTFIARPAHDKDALKEMRDAARVENAMLDKQKDLLSQAVLARVAFGERSPYLQRLTKKQVGRLKTDSMMTWLSALLDYECSVLYCGKLPHERIAALAKEKLPISKCRKPQEDRYIPFKSYSEPTIFFYEMKDSRQNNVMTYDVLPPCPTWDERGVAVLWGENFGGGMSSLLFQHIREFSALAYSTHGELAQPDMLKHADAPLAYISVTGTQADKTPQVMTTIDSLLHLSDISEENLASARQQIVNDANNRYPSFRNIAAYIASLRAAGYDHDPQADLLRVLPTVDADNVRQFQRQHVTLIGNRVWIVVGNKKTFDKKRLEKYGKVIQLKKKDIVR